MPKTKAYENTGVEQQYVPKTDVLRFYLDPKCKQPLDFSEWRHENLKLSQAAKKLWIRNGRKPIFFQMYWDGEERDEPGEIQVHDVSNDQHLVKMEKHKDLVRFYDADQNPLKYEQRKPSPIKYTGRRFYARPMRFFRRLFAIFFFVVLILGGIDGVRYFSTSKTLYDEMTKLEKRLYEISSVAGVSLASYEAAVNGHAPAQELGSQNMADYNARLEKLRELEERNLSSPSQIFDVQDKIFRTQVDLGKIHSEIGALAGASSADQELLEDVLVQYEHAEQQYMNYTYPTHLRVNYGLARTLVQKLVEWSD